MTTAKNEFFIRLKHENFYLMGGKGGIICWEWGRVC